MSFPAYESYRDSGVEWLGRVPSHWETKPLKAVTSCNDEVLTEATPPDYEIEYVEISDVQAGQGIKGSTSYSFSDAPSRARRKLRDGDVLVSTVRTYLRAIAQVREPAENLIASTGFAVLRPQRAHSDFIGYAVQAEETINEIIARSVGVSYPAINASDLVRIAIAVPPLAEQRAIAAFLDRETAKIDALVEAQERLIALLKEKRQAVISHAVTKGLDPSAPMKDSGVEWLGQVPAHWEVRPLKALGEFNAGAGFPHDEQGVENEPLQFHKVNALSDADEFGYLTPGENTISHETALRLRAHVFPAGSIVFAKIGAALLLGRIRQLSAPACLDNNMMGFTHYEPNEVQFLRHSFALVRFDLIANPGTVPSLNAGQIANFVIPVPPP